MKVYSFFTDSHRSLYEKFVDSFPFEPNFDLQLRYFGQDCLSGKFMSNGWSKTMRKKLEYVLYSLEETAEGEVFVHSDIDVVFFGPIKDDILSLMSGWDILFQKDSEKELCMGFFACVKSPSTVSFFREVLKRLDEFKNDQIAANMMIGKSGLKYGFLPERYFSVGVKNGIWRGQQSIYVPEGVLVHHANWTVGVENKLKLIELVRRKRIDQIQIGL